MHNIYIYIYIYIYTHTDTDRQTDTDTDIHTQKQTQTQAKTHIHNTKTVAGENLGKLVILRIWLVKLCTPLARHTKFKNHNRLFYHRVQY